MRKFWSHSLLAALTLATSSGCNSTVNQDDLRPALLSEPNQQEVATLVAQALNIKEVKVREDVFMQKSSLVLESPPFSDAQGNPLIGKQLEMPQRFMLLTDGQLCYLQHLNSEQILPAPTLTCR
ncbi:hypothetical protein [Pseudoalteromonas sp. T1lg10]|uniref:hypothetical protein n=1 Tax=Pseudoalteromonas sp. T1lg10 TaxID=2077093 RepID=UPI000CF61E8C|nr:hypothetical protein [Pseudoalteromonas sp. T1lg10]